jgi:hypothetical protein
MLVFTGLASPRMAGADDAANIATLDHWTTLGGQPVTRGWKVVDGTIHLGASKSRAGDIVTAIDYADFELEFQWKIAAGGNSGIKYRVRDFDGKVLGLEYQICDDSVLNDRGNSNQSTGAIYELYEPNHNKVLNPPGQFNRGKIVVHGNWIEHWLNGQLIVTAQIGSSEWYRRKARSKFADVDGFGENWQGKIMLTDHGSEVWYRDLTIRPLISTEPSESRFTSIQNRPRFGRRVARWKTLFRR